MDARMVAADFLREQGMDPGQIDMAELCRQFIDEMDRGLAGMPSSLAMLPSFMTPPRDIPLDCPVLAIDAGGTHFRAATVYFNREHQPVIENYRQMIMPGADESISSEEFFRALADEVKDLAGLNRRIGFCFSYPVEMLPEKDGRLIRLAKEMQVSGIAGRLVGHSLLQALQTADCGKNSQVVLLNDTVAAFLAGFIRRQDDPAAQIGLILGTGSNTSYLEQGARISKITHWPSEQEMIVNVESGAFDKAPRGKVDLEFDARLKDPGCFQLEKMIAGKYLGSLFLAVIKKAAAAGLFSLTYAANLAKLSDVNNMPTAALNRILLNLRGAEESNILAGANPQDERIFTALAELLVERAGVLTAAVLSALVRKTGCGHDPNHPVTITAEGSTFYRLQGLQEQIKLQMAKYLSAERGLHFQFQQVENAVLIGAAVAALTG